MNISISAFTASPSRATPAAGSASRQSPRRSRAAPRSMPTRTASRSCCRRISSCRRAVSTSAGPTRRATPLGIVTTGKAYLDVRQALADLGLDDKAAAALGIRLYKVGLTWPLEASGARRFAEGLEDVLVVEEKRGLIEDQLVKLLYNMEASRRPSIVGKRDEAGRVLLPSEGEINPTMVA